MADLVRLAGGELVSRDHDGALRSNGAAGSRLARALAAPGPRAFALGATADGRTLVVGDADGWLRLFDADGTPGAAVTLPAGVPVTSAACLRADDGEDVVVVAGLADGSITLWAPPKPPLERSLTYRGTQPVAIAAARTRVGPVIAIAWADQVVTVHRPGEGPAQAAHPYHDVLALALAPDGVLVGAGYDGVTCWECDLDRLA
jgi:WD40 repeat protein